MKTEMYTYIQNEVRTVLPSNPGFERWLDPERTAIVCIDMHRGHVGPGEPEELTCPAPRARNRIADHNRFHANCRELGIPIVFVQCWLRHGGFETEGSAHGGTPWAPYLIYPLYLPESPLLHEHSWEGTKWLDLMVENDPERDY